MLGPKKKMATQHLHGATSYSAAITSATALVAGANMHVNIRTDVAGTLLFKGSDTGASFVTVRSVTVPGDSVAAVYSMPYATRYGQFVYTADSAPSVFTLFATIQS